MKSKEKTYRIANIVWDKDEDDWSILPSELTIAVDMGEDDLEEWISDWLSETFGYCHKGFTYEEVR